MKRTFSLALVLLAGLSFVPAHAEGDRSRGIDKYVQHLNGSPTGATPQSIAVSTTSATQSTALTEGTVVEVVNDGSTKIYCRPVTSSSGTVTTSNGRPIVADAGVVWTLADDETHIACITSSGTSTARIFVYR